MTTLKQSYAFCYPGLPSEQCKDWNIYHLLSSVSTVILQLEMFCLGKTTSRRWQIMEWHVTCTSSWCTRRKHRYKCQWEIVDDLLNDTFLSFALFCEKSIQKPQIQRMQMGVDISAFINMAGDQLFSIWKNIKQKQQNNKNKKHEGGWNSDA